MPYQTPSSDPALFSTSPIDDSMSLLTGGLFSGTSSLATSGLANLEGFQTGPSSFGPAPNPYFLQVVTPDGAASPVSTAGMSPATITALSSLVGANDGLVEQVLVPNLPAPPNFLIAHNTYDGEDTEIATYSGSDMHVAIEVPNPDGSGRSQFREFIELSTLSISIYRVKAPARACGYINPKGFARGTRTIAGTMVLTQFTVDVLYRFLYNVRQSTDLSKDSQYRKPDQLPPFNLTIYFTDEFGNRSYRRLLGVDMANDGTVYSNKDFYSEQTISYMAADFTPLLPAESSPQAVNDPTSMAAKQQKTPMSVLMTSNRGQII